MKGAKHGCHGCSDLSERRGVGEEEGHPGALLSIVLLLSGPSLRPGMDVLLGWWCPWHPRMEYSPGTPFSLGVGPAQVS